MSGLFDVDLISRILSVDRKLRLLGTDKRRERDREHAREDRVRGFPVRESGEEESEGRGAVDITV